MRVYDTAFHHWRNDLSGLRGLYRGRPGKRYAITITDYEYDETLELYCEEYEEYFEVIRFAQYSNSPDALIELCESHATLVAYAEFRQNAKYGDQYRVIQLEDMNGTVYRTYEHTNELDKYSMVFLWVVFFVVLIPHLLLFSMMMSVILWPEKFLEHPRFVKFRFPDYSLPSPKRKRKKSPRS